MAAAPFVSFELLLRLLMPKRFGAWDKEWMDFLRARDAGFSGIMCSKERQKITICFGCRVPMAKIEEFVFARRPFWRGANLERFFRFVNGRVAIACVKPDDGAE